MNKFVSLDIFNFESHRETHVTFADGVTVIQGESEHGKSAILRAIYWVMFNRPSGEEFCSKWGGLTKVELTTDTVKITREKGPKVNRYTLETLHNGSKLHFNGFGQAVPPEIAEALKIEPINVQTQFEGHFLLPPISSGEVAKQINQYVNLEIIDTSIAAANAAVRDFDKEVQAKTASMKALEAEINEKFAYLDDAEKQLKSIETIEKRLSSLLEKQASLEEVLLTRESLDLTPYKYIENAEKDLIKLEKIRENYEKTTKETRQLRDLLQKWVTVQNQSREFESVKNREVDIRSLDNLTTEINRNRETTNQLEELFLSGRRVSKDITQTTQKIKTTETQIEKLMPKGSQCILCGGIIK